jgi:hypothetical protein
MMARRQTLISSLTWAAFSCACISFGSPIVATPLALKGQPVPSAYGALTFDTFSLPASIDSTGAVLFNAALAGPDSQRFYEDSIWYGKPGSLSLVARDTQQAPGTPGSRFGDVSAGWVSLDGRVSLSTRLYGPGINSTNSPAVFTGTVNSLQLLAQAGSPAPGTPAGTRFTWFHPFRPHLGDGRIAMAARLNGPNVTEDNDDGIWVARPTELSLFLREGHQAPGFPQGAVIDFLDYPRGSENGTTLVYGSVEGAVAATALWSGGANGLNIVIRSGDQAPGFDPGHQITFLYFHHISSRDYLGLVGSTHRGGAEPQRGSAAWVGRAGDLRAIAREGDPAPGPSGAAPAHFSGFSEVWPFGDGNAVIRAAVRDTPVDQTAHVGYWAQSDGTLRLLFREGVASPGLGDGTFISAISDTFVNDRGDVVAQLRLAGPGVTSENEDSLWYGDAAGAVRLIAREGDLLTLDDGSQQRITSLGSVAYLNENGQFLFGAQLADGRGGLFISAIPEPSSVTLFGCALICLVVCVGRRFLNR